MTITQSNALVRVKDEPEILMTDIMGSVVVIMEVGPQKKIFVVHHKLMSDASEVLADYFSMHPDPTKVYPLPGTSVEVFAFFVEILYSRRVPGVGAGSSNVVQAARIRTLCQLYTFGLVFKLKEEMLTTVLNTIQDGFRIMDSFPEHGLVQNIYRHTSPGDKLRKFCASCLVYSFIRGGDDSINEGVEKLLKDDSGILRDFLVTLRDFGGHSHDPRFSEEGDQIKQQSVEG